MFKSVKTNETIIFIRSEPNDGTRYDYGVYKYYDDYIFFPVESTIIFPQKINKWEVSTSKDYSAKQLYETGMPDEIRARAERTGANPWTVAECFRTVQKLEKGEIE
jgi:hypothetical protein